MFAFPWGVPGTALADESGPEPWQRDVLETAGPCSTANARAPDEAVRVAVASGHGVGKSALVAWIILWALSTLARHARHRHRQHRGRSCAPRPGPSSPSGYALCGQQGTGSPTPRRRSSFAAARPRQDLAASMPSPGRRTTPRPSPACTTRAAAPSPLFDEASSIPDGVWDTIEGALTDAEHRAVLAGIRQSDAQHRPLPRMFRRRPLRPSLAARADRFALGRR